jgi:hypothetical protein
VSDLNAGVNKLGFNKVGGGILLASWIVILVVVVVLVRGRCWLAGLAGWLAGWIGWVLCCDQGCLVGAAGCTHAARAKKAWQEGSCSY